MQIVTYAVSLPLWLTLYLSTASSITSSGSNLPSALDSDSIPACVILGFFVPAILSAIPLSESQTTNRKLGYMALWQMFPLWTGLLHQFARNLLPLLGVSQYTSAVTQQRTSKAIRRFYMTALLIATSTRCASLVVKLGTDYSTSMLTVLPVSLPSPFRISAFKTLEEGIAEFLAYDEIIGSFSLVIWAIFDLGKLLVNQDLVQQLQVLGGLLVAFFFAGPAGLILGTRWARDELLGL